MGASDTVLSVRVWVVPQAVTRKRKLAGDGEVSAVVSLTARFRCQFGMIFLVLLLPEKDGFSTELYLKLCLVLTAMDTNTF